jgi:hypothetical protein
MTYVAVQEYPHSYKAFQELSYPEEQDPQLIAFIGDKIKSQIAREDATGKITSA